jgi:hypothetical protein
MKFAFALASFLLSGLIPAGAASGCKLPSSDTAMIGTGPARFSAALRTSPSPVVVGAPFVVQLLVCANDGTRINRLTMDANMPAHRHGMNYVPEISPLGDGLYEGRGFLFHMPGRWEVTVSVYSDAEPSHLKFGLDVK